MEPKYNPSYCSRCYQYNANAREQSEACRACFGENTMNIQTSFEAAFTVVSDLDGETGKPTGYSASEKKEAEISLYQYKTR